MNASEGAPSKHWLTERLRSFTYAGRGVWLLRTEPNAQIHLCVTAAVVIVGVVARLAALEWALLVLAIALVLAAEAVNTALERLANAAVPERHPLVGAAKDLAAGAVLITAVGAALVGALVLGPHLVALAAHSLGK